MPRAGRNIILFLASGFGAGYLPYCPGTFGTLIGVPVSLIVSRIALNEPWLGAISLAALAAIAIWSAGRAARILGKKDPPTITIDEIAGFALASFLTVTLTGLAIAFVLFRFFDIAKIFPARRLEALPGGAGIVLDDMLAGVYTFLILRLLSWIGLV
ncbi:MAG: phosphatidylglycerophosphatase A family protein [Candidatus Binatia bacterium]